MSFHEFVVKQTRVKSVRDVLILLLKVAIILIIAGEAFDGIRYLKCLLGSNGIPLAVYFFCAKQVIFILIIYLLYRLAKRFQKKGTLKRAMVIFLVLSIFTSWINGSILGILFWDGPYWGRVVDADTGEPVVGANVVARWNFVILLFPITATESFADARETVTDEKGRFVVPIARTVWLWPLSWIELDDINVYKPGYDSHPPRMQKAWTAEEKAKWRIKMRNLNPNYDQSLNPGVNYEIAFRKLPKDIKIYKPTTIRLNRAGSVEEQWKAVAVPLGGGLRGCKRYKVKKVFNVVRAEKGKLSIARRQRN